MIRSKYYIAIILALCLSCSASKSRRTTLNITQPSVFFEFKGINPRVFRELENNLEKRFLKTNTEVGYNYSFITPPRDNSDYLNLPEYIYDTDFDFVFAITLLSIGSNSFNPKERETNIDYYYNVEVFNKDEIVLYNKEIVINQASLGDYNTSRLSKIISNIYKKQVKIE